MNSTDLKKSLSRDLNFRICRANRDALPNWLHFHANPIVLAEAFVDAARFKDTCYRAAGWKEIGQPLIYEAIAMAFPGWDLNRPGTWSSSRTRAPADSVRPLVADAASILFAPFLPPVAFSQKGKEPMITINRNS